jgi:hypothetical protein
MSWTLARFRSRNAACRRAPPRKPASAAARAIPNNPEAHKFLRWITRVTLIATDPSPVRFNPRSNDFVQLWRRAAAETNIRRPPSRRLRSCQIGPSGASSCRSDHPNWNVSESSDLDPTIQIRRYPFGLAILLKSLWVFSKSTRSPAPFKRNSI